MDLTRRQLLKTFGCAGAGITLTALGLDVREVRAATQDFKLEGAKEYTSICTFCSCGCSMLCHVKDGKLINLEGDPDSVINEGALCSKGASMGVIPNSDQRAKTPLYRAPGSDKWQEISWDEAIDRMAKKMKETRDKNWIDTEKVKDKDGVEKEYKVNRTDALSFLGGAQNPNEECYLFTKFARIMGTDFVEHQARV
jgi:formate dehydrogenase major subunit